MLYRLVFSLISSQFDVIGREMETAFLIVVPRYLHHSAPKKNSGVFEVQFDFGRFMILSQ